MQAHWIAWLFGAVAALLLFALWWFAWGAVLRWLRVLWVCRVPALSVGLGVLLFWLAGPARDLFMESGKENLLYWSAFFVLVTLWAMIVHFAARKVLEQQAWAGRPPLDPDNQARLRLLYRGPATWLPRLLGLVCFAAVAIGIVGAHNDVTPVIRTLGLNEPLQLLWGAAFGCLVYLAYVIFRRPLLHAATRGRLDWDELRSALAESNDTLLTEEKAFWFADLASAEGRQARSLAVGGGHWDLLAVGLLALQAGIWLLAIIAPLFVSEWLPRAVFAVAMLALPVSLLSFMSALSHQWRLPIVTLTLLGLVVLTGQNEQFHDLRTRPVAQGAAAAPRQVALAEAVRSWKRFNCPDAAASDSAPCPVRPVIVASAGGASRAGFFTATIVGELLDHRELDLRRRLFAISGVSGGSVGAAMIRAALADAAEGGPPCTQLTRLWWGPAEDYGPKAKNPITWKPCLQALMVGDFLSPAFVGLAFRDLFGFLDRSGVTLHDRAVLLEKAFERSYDDLTADPAGRRRTGLHPFLGWADPQAGANWVPLLLLNTTTVTEGRRAIVSDLLPYRCDGGITERLFPTAFDVFEILTERFGDCAATPGPLARGVRLSTAATASARFPVISPQAALRDPGGRLRDMVVDGGYFENDGLTTARELAEALVRLELRPIILHITNNPGPARAGSVEPPPDPVKPRWYDAFVAPLGALAHTRDGHAAAATYRARRTANTDTLPFQVFNQAPRLADGASCTATSPGEVREGDPTVTDVAMSWWLSGAVQEYLDRQLCHPENVKSFKALMQLSTSP